MSPVGGGPTLLIGELGACGGPENSEREGELRPEVDAATAEERGPTLGESCGSVKIRRGVRISAGGDGSGTRL